MPYIDVGALRNQRKQAEENQKRAKKFAEAKDKRIIKARRQPLGRKPKPEPQPIMQYFEHPTPAFEFEQEYSDIKEKINEKLLEILSLPAKQKRDVLQQKLTNSTFIRKYLRRKADFGMFDGYINENILFAILYFIYYEEAINSKNNFCSTNIHVIKPLPNIKIDTAGGQSANQPAPVQHDREVGQNRTENDTSGKSN